MTKLKLLRLEAKLSELNRATVSKADKGENVSELSLNKITSTLSQQLGRSLNPEEFLVN